MLKCQLQKLGHKRGKEFRKRFKHLYSNVSDNIGPIRNSQRQLICEEHGIASEFKRTFFEAHHIWSEIFNEDPTRNCENFTTPDEFTQQTLDADFTNRDLDKVLQGLPLCNSFDNDIIHPNTLYSNVSDNIGPIRNSQRQLICEEHGIASEFKRTFFEEHHMGSELFNENPTRNCENFTTPDEFTQQTLNADFTNRDLDKALQGLPLCNSFDNDIIHPNMLRHFGPSMTLAILE